MHETRWRKAGNPCQRLERKIVQWRYWILKVAQDPPNPGVDRNAPPRLDEEFAQPPFCTRFVWRAAQHGPPTTDLTCGHTCNLSIDEFGKRRAHGALCADEGNQQGSTSRIDLVTGVGAHPDGATPFPRFPRSATHPKSSAQGHHQLDRVVAVRGGLEA